MVRANNFPIPVSWVILQLLLCGNFNGNTAKKNNSINIEKNTDGHQDAQIILHIRFSDLNESVNCI